jgi:hypothetical protein
MLGIAVAAHRHHPVAGRKAPCLGPDRHDLAGRLEAGDRQPAHIVLLGPGEVGPVEAGRLHPDEKVVRAGLRFRHGLELQRRAVRSRCDDDRAHASLRIRTASRGPVRFL